MAGENEVNPKEYFNEILRQVYACGASDLHFKVGLPPIVRVMGNLQPLSEKNKHIIPNDTESIAKSILSPQLWEKLEDLDEVDIGYGVRGIGRFRINIFKQRGSISMVARMVPYNVKSIDDLNLPTVIKQLASENSGMILITGPTGSGKSTTLAAIVDYINSTRTNHIVTIENPIEFLIRDQKSIITQREVDVDTKGFDSGLRHSLRQDPNVIMLGEMPDLATTSTALKAAEAGHLLLSALPTSDAVDSINRIISLFPADKQLHVRLQLSTVLKGIVSQRLVLRKDNKGLVVTAEILIVNPKVQEMIIDPSRTKEIANEVEVHNNAVA